VAAVAPRRAHDGRMRGAIALVVLGACHVGGSVPIGYGNHGWSIGAEGEGGVSNARVGVGHLRGFDGHGFTYGDLGMLFGRSDAVNGLATIGAGTGAGWQVQYGIGVVPRDVSTGVYAELGLRVIADRIDLVLQPGVTRAWSR
jgi:hypothetical protein